MHCTRTLQKLLTKNLCSQCCGGILNPFQEKIPKPQVFAFLVPALPNSRKDVFVDFVAILSKKDPEGKKEKKSFKNSKNIANGI